MLAMGLSLEPRARPVLIVDDDVETLSAERELLVENGFRVVDVWESEDAFRRFGETLMPILEEIGVEGQPEIYPAHTFVSG